MSPLVLALVVSAAAIHATWNLLAKQAGGDNRFALLTVTTDLQREGIKHFLANLHVLVPVLFDEDQAVSQAYLVRALPTTVFIDRQGALIGRAVGPREWDTPKAVQAIQSLMP